MSPEDAGWEKIVLSARAFGHLSQGLYRTPAGAIKELISNSFDADAKNVRIHTDFPRFLTFACDDDGNGMPLEEFNRLVSKGIGESLKRSAGVQTRGGRPYIGRLGLGILALAQICTQFDLTSHHKKSKAAFTATIKFLPYTREEMDKKAAEVQKIGEPVQGGHYRARAISFDSKAPSVRIFTKYIRHTYQSVMRDLEHFGNKVTSGKGESVNPYPSFDSFLDSIYPGKELTRSLTERSDYEQLLFGLALAPPLPFIPDRNVVVNLPMVAKRQKALESFDFRLEIDNMRLLNPLCLPSDRDRTAPSSCEFSGPTKISFEMKDGVFKEDCPVTRRRVFVRGSDLTFNLYDFAYKDEVGGRRLAFSGYIFQQTGRLYPQDIQGVLIRINNVAIGKYDNSLLNYPTAEGPRFSMVSSELLIEDGFEDALNIDRDSLNELHPHYIRVRRYFHCLLGQWIFPETWTEEHHRNEGRRKLARQEKQKGFSEVYRETTGKVLSKIGYIEREAAAKPEQAFRQPAVEFRARATDLDAAHPVVRALRRKKSVLPIVERLLIAFERANVETNIARRREVFYKLLLEIFK